MTGWKGPVVFLSRWDHLFIQCVSTDPIYFILNNQEKQLSSWQQEGDVEKKQRFKEQECYS